MKAQDLTTTPTAKLLTEWERLDDIRPIDRGVASIYHEQCDSIAAELDRRCEDAGLCILTNGQFRLQTAIQAIELRDLLTWLLTKGGNG